MKNILLIDPNPITALDIYIHLQDQGYIVHGPIATDGEGLSLLANENISLIILDDAACQSHYPELYQVLMQSELPIIFLTDSYVSNDDNKVTFKKTDPAHQLMPIIKNLNALSEAA